MTNDERKEFEAHKKRAEKQISEMYYGKSNGSGQNLSMPPFLKKPEQNQTSKPKASFEEKEAVSPPKNEKNSRLNLLELLNFKNITMDNDRITILALCLLLSSEGADELLILALIYIML